MKADETDELGQGLVEAEASAATPASAGSSTSAMHAVTL